MVSYKVHLNQGGYDFAVGEFKTLLLANQRLKIARECGFPQAYIVMQTVEILKDQFVIATLEQAERLSPKMKFA